MRTAIAGAGLGLDALLDDLAARVADRVAEKLQSRLAAPSSVYTSAQLPPDVKTRERFNRLAKSIPGARRDGRTWIVPKTAWEAFRTRRVAAEPPAAAAADDADELLAAAGLRPVLRSVQGGRR